MEISNGIFAKGNQKQLQLLVNQKKDLSVGFIGGSITNGTGASKKELNYVSLVTNWLQEINSEIKVINAGIGGTDSEYGLLRLKRDIGCPIPNIVFVEFSVNDKKRYNQATFDALLQKIILLGSYPVVIENFRYFTGESFSETHTKVAQKYNLPILNLQNIFDKNEQLDSVLMHTYSVDGLHPNDHGHELIFFLIKRFLNSTIEENEFNHIRLISPRNLKLVSSNLKFVDLDYKFANGALLDKPGEVFSWTGKTSFLGVQYRRTREANNYYLEIEINGDTVDEKFEIYVDHSDSRGDLLIISNLWSTDHLENVQISCNLRGISNENKGIPIYLTGIIVSEEENHE